MHGIMVFALMNCVAVECFPALILKYKISNKNIFLSYTLARNDTKPIHVRI